MTQPGIAHLVAEPPTVLHVTWHDGSETRHDVATLISDTDWAAPLRDPAVFVTARAEDHGLQIVWPGTGVAFSAHGLWDDAHPPPPTAQWMLAGEFTAWMREMGWSFARAAEALGISQRMLKYYAAGTHAVPKPVCLACMHLAAEATRRRQPAPAVHTA